MPTLEERVASLEAQIQQATDRQAIIELTGRYCQAVASDDLDALLSLFTEDASLHTQFPPGSGQAHSETTGKAALRETYRGTQGMALKPCVHNHIIELDGDSARGFCSFEVRLVQDGVAYIGSGHYHDDYLRVAGDWRFQRRSLVLYHWVPQTEGWA